MADHSAITAVSRTLRTLLLDRLTGTASVTLAPPDVAVSGVTGARINLYLYQIMENAELRNQEIPGRGHAASYGRPPLSLNLRYLLTTHSATEDTPDSDLNAQTLLGDAMRVLHEYGGRLDSLAITRGSVGTIGEPVLDPALRDEYERVKLLLHPASLDDLTKIWSALSEENFRRSIAYDVTVVQIESTEPRLAAQPVETRRIHSIVRKRPVIRQLYVTPGPVEPMGELRARVGDQVTIIAEHVLADRLYVRFGKLERIRISPPGDGRIRLLVPDDQYPIDPDHPVPRPILLADRLQPGPIEVQLMAQHPVEGVEGGLAAGINIAQDRRFRSNTALLQLVPRITGLTPALGPSTSVLQVSGSRLWHPAAGTAEVIVGDVAVAIRPPQPGDPWAVPTPTLVEIPVSDAAALLPTPQPGDDPYPVAVQVDGARSRDTGFDFTLTP